nr:hypothetical protein [uncultured Desulfuromonas sp.]
MTLSRRNLKGIAGGVAHQFNCSTSYYAFQAVVNDQPQAKINLLSLEITPELFNVERNRIFAGMCQGTLTGAISRWPDLELKSAELVIDFDLSSLDGKGIMATAVVTLCDEGGQQWVSQDHSYIIIDWRERKERGV